MKLSAQLLQEEKKQMKQTGRAARLPHRKFLESLFTLCEGRTIRHAKLLPSARDFIEINTGISGLHFRYVVGQDETRVELYIHRKDVTTNKRIYDELLPRKAAIEGDFGEILSWERLDDKIACRIAHRMNGGSRYNEAKWQAIQTTMIDAMIRFEEALSPFIDKLTNLK